MTLDIVIPHYKEPLSVGVQGMRMLAAQRLINFDDIHVYIVQDGEEGSLPPNSFVGHPFRIDVVTIPHSGISAARNAGMRAGTGEWVMFCDFDDAFSSVYGLYCMMLNANPEKYDMVVAGFTSEEQTSDGAQFLMSHDGTDMIFIHGKMFRREWLEKEGICFDNRLTIHEDSYFVMLSRILINPARVVVVPREVYAAQWNGNSVTRSMECFSLETWDKFLMKMDALAKVLERRGKLYWATKVVCQALCDTYMSLFRKSWRGRDTSGVMPAAKKFARDNAQFIQRITETDYRTAMKAARDVIEEQLDMGMETISFPEWLKKVKEDAD